MKIRFILFFLFIGVYAHGQRIFWTQDGSINQIRSANMDGTDIQTHLTDADGPRYISVDRSNNILFYVTQSPNRGKRVNLSTFGSSITIYDWPAFTAAVNLSHHPGDDQVYYNGFVDSDDVRIERSAYTDQDCCNTPQSLDLGTLAEPGSFFDINIDTDNERVYTSYDGNGRIYYRPTFASGFAATPIVIVNSGGGESFDVDLGDRRLVYEDPANDRIVVRDMDDGSGFGVLIASGFTNIKAINVDQQQSRVVVLDGTTIKTAENDGSNLTTVLSGLTSAEDISIMSCSDPSTQVSALTATGASTTSIGLSWTNGNGDNTIIVAKEGSAVDQAPRDGELSTANVFFGSGDQLGTGNYVVYRGTGTSTTVFTLSPATEYHFAAYTYDSFGACYRTFSPSITSAFTDCNNPTAAPTGGSTSSLTATTTNLNWTNGDGNSRIVVLKEGSAVDFTPTDLTDYGAGDTDFGVDALGGGNFLINNVTTNTTSIGALSASTTYFYAIFENESATDCYGPALTGSFTTLCIDPGTQSTNMAQSGLLSTTVDLNWTNGNGTNRIVLAEQSSGTSVSQPPVDGATYTANATFGSGDDLGGGVFVVYSGTGSTVSVDGLTSSTDYVFTVFEFNSIGGLCYNEGIGGTNSVSLTTLDDWTFSATSTATLLSSLQDTQPEGQANISMELTFTGGGPDLRITDLIFTQGVGNDVADWTDVIGGAALFYPGEGLTEIGTVGATGISFSGFATCGSCIGRIGTGDTYELYVWLKSPLDIDADGSNLVFQLTDTDIVLGGGGSSVLAAGATANSGAANNEIQVIATDLAFVQQPTDNNVNVAMTPAVTVEANDANGNIDLDFIQQIDITSTGTLSVSPVSVNATSGSATFSTITHTISGTNLTLSAASTGQSTATSNQFNIVAIPEPLEHVSGFNVDGAGLTTIDLSWVESVNPQLAESYLLQAIADGSSFPAVADGTDQLDDTDLSDGIITVNLVAGITSYQLTGATPAVQYTFRIYPYTNSGVDIDYKTDGTIPEQTATTLANSDSDVIPTSPFSVPVNINYLSFLGADATNGSFLLGSIDIRDGGAGNDADGVPTVLTDITFSLTNSANISRIALYDGSTELGEVAGGATATFTGLSASAPDDGVLTLEVYVTFNTTVTDGQQIQINVSSVTGQAANSGFAAADGGGATILNAPIEVLATAINILQQPSSAADQYVTLPQQPIFEAVDVNGNRDIDFTEPFDVGTADPDNLLPVSPLTTFTNGLADFAGSGYNFEGTGTSTMHILTTGGAALLSPNTVAITVTGTPPSITVATPTDDMACIGGDGTIDVTGVTPGALTDYSFELFDDTPASVSTTGPLFTGLEAGDYTVVATNNNSGISSPNFAVTVGETLPVINGLLAIGGGFATDICDGESTSLSVTITGTGGGPYDIDIDDGSGVSTINGYNSGDAIPVTPTSNTTYTLVAVTDANGCTGGVSGTVDVVINTIPIVGATGGDNTACAPFNGSIDLVVTGSSGDVTYDITGAQNVNFSGTATETATDLAPGDYTITVTDNVTTCISLPVDVTITDISDRPTVVAGSDTNLCEGETVSLSAAPSGGDSNYSFLWDNAGTLDDPTAQSPQATPTVTTTYSVTVTDGLGCVSDASNVTITVSPQFQSVTLTNSGASTICEGEDATLIATMVGGTGPYSFALSDGTPVTNYISGSAITVSPTSSTVYTIVSIEDDFSCSASTISGSVTINVDQIPSAATVGSDDNTCEITYGNLGGNVPTVGTGVWSTTGTATIDTPTSATTSVSNLAFGDNSFTWTITNGVCVQSNTATIIISREEPPTGSGTISGNTELCSDAQGVTYTLSGIIGATSYTWTLPTGFTAGSLTTTEPSITVNLQEGQAGNVEATASNECGSIASTGLTVSIIQAAQVDIIVPDEIKPGRETEFSFNSTVGLSAVNWSFGDGGASSTANPIYIYERAGTYTVELAFQNEEGCTGTTTLAITVVPRETVTIKNAITPNGDGQNDFLIIEGILDYPDNKVTLFDRWGVEVTRFNGYTNDWDLLISGDYIPAGNYICVVELPETGETIKRSITVIKGD